jgi:hypothetical protein
MITAGISFHDAPIDRERFTLDQTGSMHAGTTAPCCLPNLSSISLTKCNFFLPPWTRASSSLKYDFQDRM